MLNESEMAFIAFTVNSEFVAIILFYIIFGNSDKRLIRDVKNRDHGMIYLYM